MKYIPADKLIAEIERRMNDYSASIVKYYGSIKAERDSWKRAECKWFLNIIASLQQDQRETNGDDGKFVKILVRKEFAEQIQRLGDEIQAGQSSFVGAMNQQEQPDVDVDLEKLGEIARHIIAVKQNVEDMRLSEDEWSLLERIGYPQKLNARKED